MAERVLVAEGITVKLNTFRLKFFQILDFYCAVRAKIIYIDLAFVAASAYSKDCGFTCGNDGESVIKNFVCKKARKVALLVDSSKIDTVLPFTFATQEDIDYFICDKAVPTELSERFRQKGITIL